ncbi:hypothetical protein BDA96_05G166800 [Sorghum bicolor]|uniref:Knottin scorpion toxin-like domain-containing protein n=2 Tax=Sorghum bicolor TaxID=4558 RepID=A0A921R0U6_SORBI|nr:uncharacterized protein LOC110435362 [Sorghum bicolor]KAG0530220.1 hypothetical protein BDA96_05G166800 [Sorghum bicolor]KXG28683.1 hypothetical protein SORBI_3005G152700 [Sorghum bicolor]|eukprot:XP_021316506.1 uncharacterized protein LOC110435362 [Sorghum bicolor]
MSMNRKHLVAGFFFINLTLLMASYCSAALCGTRTKYTCTVDKMCEMICQQVNCDQQNCGYTGGHCSDDSLCVCTKPCSAQSTMAPPGEKPAVEEAYGRMALDENRMLNS